MKSKFPTFIILFVVSLFVFASCHSSTVWGHKDASTPTKFSTDKRYIRH